MKCPFKSPGCDCDFFFLTSMSSWTPWSIVKFNAATRQLGVQVSKKSTTKRRGSKPAARMKGNIGSPLLATKAKLRSNSHPVKVSSTMPYLLNRPFRVVVYTNSSPLRPTAAAEASYRPMSFPIHPCITSLSCVTSHSRSCFCYKYPALSSTL